MRATRNVEGPCVVSAQTAIPIPIQAGPVGTAPSKLVRGTIQEDPGEAHLPTKDAPSCASSRLSSSHVRTFGSLHREGPAAQGPRTPVGLTWRLTGRQAFRSLRQAGRKGHSGPVTVIAAPSDAARPRVAFALGRKLGPAVTRNLIRRRLRHLLSSLEQGGELPTMDYLIIGSPGIATLTFEQLRAHLSRAIVAATRR